MARWTTEELLACVLSRLVQGLPHIAVGALSPIPAAAALLAREAGAGRTRVSILGSPRHLAFTDGGREIFDCAAQGRIDAFFLSGAQIDGRANINLVGVGNLVDAGSGPRAGVAGGSGSPANPVTPSAAASRQEAADVDDRAAASFRPARRFPGSFGSAYLYSLVPHVILFRLEHTPRVLVRQVDFVSAAGVSPPHEYRPGGPRYLVTNRCVFRFARDIARFTLASVHPGQTVDEIVAQTGFDFELPAAVATTPAPEPHELALLRGRVREELREAYPRFTASHFLPDAGQ